jgi:mono/diheme cytochrome c family protein
MMIRTHHTVALTLAALPLVLGGCRATPSGKVETRVMTAIKHHVTVGNKDQKNPLPVTAENIAAGKEAFSHYCVACHGNDGQNFGVPFADRLSPQVPSLKSDVVQTYTDGQLKWVIDYGLSPSGMPGSHGILSDEEIWSTVLYIRHLPPAGSVGEPEMYQH